MKTYQVITNSNQVSIGTILVDFRPDTNEVWSTFKVYNISDNGISVDCPSGAGVFVSNEELMNNRKFHKRVN